MTTKEVIEAYFRDANAGNWDDWCNLFAENCVMDEQLAGRIEGRETLREMMKGFPDAYFKFQNVPKYIFSEGNQGAAVTHISALASKHQNEPIEADVMNYFVVEGGLITYMANFHDSKPFKPFLDQLEGK
jgi:ketosteroid isomerase-like protein